MPVHSTKKNRSKRRLKKKRQVLPESQSREIFAIVLYTLAAVFLFSLSWSAWAFWGYLEAFIISIFWIWAYLFPFVLALFASYLFFVKDLEFHFHRGLWISTLFISLLSIIHLQSPLSEAYINMKDYWWMLWFVFSTMFRMWFWDFLSWIIFLSLFIISIQLIMWLSFRELYQNIFRPLTEVDIKRSDNYENKDIEDAQIEKIRQWQLSIWNAELDIIKPEAIDFKHKEIAQDDGLSEEKLWDGWVASVWLKIKKKKNDYWIKISNFSVDDTWEFPSLDLLSSEVSNIYPDDDLLKTQADNIKEKLLQFWIKVEVVSARVWPTVTQFTLKPDEWIKVSKILSFKDDLALSLSAKSVRIEAPIPGQPYVWIEIPNEHRSTVYMKEVLTSEGFTWLWDSKLRLCMWKDVAWKSVAVDLTKMPHLLIAWATGSWKSVWMNTFLISLLYQNSPKELKFIMIDPKMVELEAYNWIPHLLTPVIMEADRALSALKWAVSEMMRRYTECREKWYRNIYEYNDSEEKKMPKIVIVVDELADLMMREYKKETEAAICRIAQMARAVWIHLIIATQRPSVDVITGLIKANIPTRISFSVTSSIDSRTIIDSIWAEDLLWMWDMLYINPSLSKPLRVQWIYISSKEIEKVTNHIKLAKEPKSDEDEIQIKWEDDGFSWVWEINLDAIKEAAQEDDKIPEAIEVIRRTWKASATLFQRMLSVWYARAAKLLDILEAKWMIGPSNWAKPREIYLDRIEGE